MASFNEPIAIGERTLVNLGGIDTEVENKEKDTPKENITEV